MRTKVTKRYTDNIIRVDIRSNWSLQRAGPVLKVETAGKC